MNKKPLIIIVGVAAAASAAGLGVYAYTNQQNIEAQDRISQAEQCTARVQSFMQRALNSGQYTERQWRAKFDPEVQQLSRDCPEQMLGE